MSNIQKFFVVVCVGMTFGRVGGVGGILKGVGGQMKMKY